jgi:competence protein ComEC
MKRPLTGVIVMFAAGILADTMLPLWIRSDWLWWATVACLAAFVAVHRSRWSVPVLMAAVTFCGAWKHRETTREVPAHHLSRIVTADTDLVSVRGMIDTEPQRFTDDSSSVRWRFLLRCAELDRGDAWVPVTGKLMVSVGGDRIGTNSLQYGESIECQALVRGETPRLNPGAFDWEDWMRREGIAAAVTVRKVDRFERLSSGHGQWLKAVSIRLCARFEGALKAGLEGESGAAVAGILTGMVLGQRAEIPDDAYQDFQRTGVFHVFAVSGLHVMLVSSAVVMVLLLCRVPRRWSGLIAIPLIVVYVMATGARPGAVRAMWMTCVWLAGWSAVRPSDPLNSLAAAGLIMLAIDPRELFDGGFILSFSVVVSLVVMAPPILAVLLPLVEPDPFLPEMLVPRWRKKLAAYGRVLAQGISGSVAACVGMVPLMAEYFHLCTPISIVANVVVVPMMQLIIGIGLMAMGAHEFSPWLAETLNNANWLALTLMVQAVRALSRLPHGYWFVSSPPIWLTVGYYALLIALVNGWHVRVWKAGRWGRVGLCGAPVLGFGVWMMAHEPVTEITVLDLNQGMSVFIDAPGDRHDWLVDGGGDAVSAQRAVIPFLRSRGVDRLGALVSTCALKSHVGGFEAVAREIPVESVVRTGTGSASAYYKRWLDLIAANGWTDKVVQAGDALVASSDAGFDVEVLYPFPDRKFGRSSDNALVLRVTVGRTRVLMMSDAGETVERLLLERGTDVRAEVVIKGQNEREASCTEDFLAAVDPDVVVAAVSARDMKRYPRPELRDWLAESGIPYWRTDEWGAITVRLRPDGYELSAIRERPR